MNATLGSWDPMTQAQRSTRRAVTAGIAILALLATAVVIGITLWPNDSSPSRDAAKGPDLTWKQLPDGSDVPISRAGGPQRFGTTTASGFARSELGASMAAIHISIGAAGGLGPKVFEPTIREQVVGDNASTMLARVASEYETERTKQGVPAGGALPTGSARLVAYTVESHNEQMAAVTVISAYADDATKFFGYRVDLLWTDGDWRLVAPPDGSFATVLTQFSSLPPDAVKLERKA